jgi:hypothetical protein
MTSSLGDASTIERAESVIQVLAQLINNPSLKAPPGPDSYSELPSKQVLFHALAKMDTTVKALQQQLTDQDTELVQAERLADEEAASTQQRVKQSFVDVDKDQN